MPVRADSDPANLRPLTGTGLAAACSREYDPGLSSSSWLLRSTSSASLTSTLTRVDVLLMTVAASRGPPSVRSS